MAAPVILDQLNYPLFNAESGIPEEIDLDSPDRFPRYYMCTSRAQTFSETWIKVKQQTPAQMAEAGFYFTDSADTVQCFHCGMKLGSWDPCDDPWIEHAIWSPECEYVIAIKGAEFPERVRNALESDDKDDLESDEGNIDTVSDLQPSNTGLREVDKSSMESVQQSPLLTPAAQSVIEMGYPPKTVKLAVDNVLQVQGLDNLTAENVMSFIFDLEDRGIVKGGELVEEKESASQACGIDLKDTCNYRLKQGVDES